MSRYRAIIADDHAIVRNSLAGILAEIGDVEVVAEAENGIETIALVKQHTPDLLLLDAAMPLARGVQVYGEARRWSPETRIIVVTGFTSTAMLADWLAAGVDGLFLKSAQPEEMQKGFAQVLAGGKFVSEEVADKLAAAPKGEDLTDREREVLALIAAGHQNAAIGEKLFISPKTVEKHRASLMSKLGVNSVSGLLTYALREGLLDEHRQL
ncbi:two component transcriptional regulator, LuxR family [Parasphingorhabdus marina DSM 22363]|uniref:Two component transcriptional regulator, LuxR family n=1 Tax=Parasphingorhabdus marina DSM 22363 TaxID=1123272 RepID=A0A1N6DC31_9SPHN|nr:response regulator transcription factor [Parasphingorhabdus marina]SIN68214.1 two component transcriptional regulator, LuxR family [Parasphingorhabdus marina DSM 22363]